MNLLQFITLTCGYLLSLSALAANLYDNKEVTVSLSISDFYASKLTKNEIDTLKKEFLSQISIDSSYSYLKTITRPTPIPFDLLFIFSVGRVSGGGGGAPIDTYKFIEDIPYSLKKNDENNAEIEFTLPSEQTKDGLTLSLDKIKISMRNAKNNRNISKILVDSNLNEIPFYVFKNETTLGFTTGKSSNGRYLMCLGNLQKSNKAKEANLGAIIDLKISHKEFHLSKFPIHECTTYKHEHMNIKTESKEFTEKLILEQWDAED